MSVSVGAVALSYFFFFLFFFFLMLVSGVLKGSVLVLEWEMSEKFFMEMGFCMVLDWVACMFVLSVLFISGCVSIFSGFYLSHENFLKRFFFLVQLFVLSMILLILFPNYLGLMVGWDGLGVVSFLLVVYYLSSNSLSAGMITALSNRIGDVCFLLVIGLMSSMLSYSMWGVLLMSGFFMGFLMMLGSMTKSAQVPFSAWLPEAMAAPTPVSTLVHSSTLVTAGVYVVIRFSEYLGELEKYLLMVFSMVTMFLAGSSACAEVDMKKVVALSTLSQVGMMMFVISVGANTIAFFHLLVHAFFKALMFMCVGGVIFYSGSCQDARLLGGAWFKLPLTSVLFLFSNLSLMGFPFFSGFYSKELIVGVCLSSNCGFLSFILLVVCLALTACYSIRSIGLVFQDMGLSSLSFYSMENSYYLLSLLLMMNGAVMMSIVMQSLIKEFLAVSFIKGSLFYSLLIMVVVFLFNLVLFFTVSMKTMFLGFSKDFFSSMWFLSLISGNLISVGVLTTISKYINYVEMGWIRTYLWQSGVKNMFMGMSNKVLKINFNMVGLVMFYSFCFLVMVFWR
uniref:NADH:ubiquinone reductase (H(+)-translocating) n=12 Tax=Ruditapes philippinarum TaxID=129788 RepID=Q7Y684_RUDPH|nr:NADH dehydrogenase subunit 5 [Ruditapes philippinarum]AAP74592.1 NADH dehydrogenase subunit 5 [Ruditapes philippinarum]AAP74613.1 NADH dehydrogenase subunit 5 [Ruditapes philippinarum]